jgi:hypothetical protein
VGDKWGFFLAVYVSRDVCVVVDGYLADGEYLQLHSFGTRRQIGGAGV